MNITIIGATGFIGQSLIDQLLTTTNHHITAFSKSANTLQQNNTKLRVVAGDLFDEQALGRALKDCDVAFYLVHMMGSGHKDYAELEAKGAEVFSKVAKHAKVQRVIFLGGLGDSHDKLSKHLQSRQRSGAIMRQHLPLVIEFRASMIIGHGSVGYEIIKAIAHKLPFIVAVPRWAVTPTQPIALQDALAYLVAAIAVPVSRSEIVEIGGPTVLTYPEILEHYTAWHHYREHVFVLRFVPMWAAKWWLNRFVSTKASGIGGPMVESLHNTMVVTNTRAKELFPDITPMPIEKAFV